MGDDTAAAPELLDGHGVVEAVPDGEHFLDVRSALFRVQDGALRPVPVAELGPFARTPEVSDQAWVVQRAGDFARMNDGALLALRTPSGTGPLRVFRGRVRDVATDGAVVCAITDDDRIVCAFTWAWARGHGPNAPDVALRLPWGDVAPLAMHEAVQVVVADRVACVRGRRGEVFCARFELPASLGETMQSAEPMLLTDAAQGRIGPRDQPRRPLRARRRRLAPLRPRARRGRGVPARPDHVAPARRDGERHRGGVDRRPRLRAVGRAHRLLGAAGARRVGRRARPPRADRWAAAHRRADRAPPPRLLGDGGTGDVLGPRARRQPPPATRDRAGARGAPARVLRPATLRRRRPRRAVPGGRGR